MKLIMNSLLDQQSAQWLLSLELQNSKEAEGDTGLKGWFSAHKMARLIFKTNESGLAHQELSNTIGTSSRRLRANQAFRKIGFDFTSSQKDQIIEKDARCLAKLIERYRVWVTGSHQPPRTKLITTGLASTSNEGLFQFLRPLISKTLQKTSHSLVDVTVDPRFLFFPVTRDTKQEYQRKLLNFVDSIEQEGKTIDGLLGKEQTFVEYIRLLLPGLDHPIRTMNVKCFRLIKQAIERKCQIGQCNQKWLFESPLYLAKSLIGLSQRCSQLLQQISVLFVLTMEFVDQLFTKAIKLMGPTQLLFRFFADIFPCIQQDISDSACGRIVAEAFSLAKDTKDLKVVYFVSSILHQRGRTIEQGVRFYKPFAQLLSSLLASDSFSEVIFGIQQVFAHFHSLEQEKSAVADQLMKRISALIGSSKLEMVQFVTNQVKLSLKTGSKYCKYCDTIVVNLIERVKLSKQIVLNTIILCFLSDSFGYLSMHSKNLVARSVIQYIDQQIAYFPYIAKIVIGISKAITQSSNGSTITVSKQIQKIYCKIVNVLRKNLFKKDKKQNKRYFMLLKQMIKINQIIQGQTLVREIQSTNRFLKREKGQQSDELSEIAKRVKFDFQKEKQVDFQAAIIKQKKFQNIKQREFKDPKKQFTSKIKKIQQDLKEVQKLQKFKQQLHRKEQAKIFQIQLQKEIQNRRNKEINVEIQRRKILQGIPLPFNHQQQLQCPFDSIKVQVPKMQYLTEEDVQPKQYKQIKFLINSYSKSFQKLYLKLINKQKEKIGLVENELDPLRLLKQFNKYKLKIAKKDYLQVVIKVIKNQSKDQIKTMKLGVGSMLSVLQVIGLNLTSIRLNQLLQMIFEQNRIAVEYVNVENKFVCLKQNVKYCLPESWVICSETIGLIIYTCVEVALFDCIQVAKDQKKTLQIVSLIVHQLVNQIEKVSRSSVVQKPDQSNQVIYINKRTKLSKQQKIMPFVKMQLKKIKEQQKVQIQLIRQKNKSLSKLKDSRKPRVDSADEQNKIQQRHFMLLERLKSNMKYKKDLKVTEQQRKIRLAGSLTQKILKQAKQSKHEAQQFQNCKINKLKQPQVEHLFETAKKKLVMLIKQYSKYNESSNFYGLQQKAIIMMLSKVNAIPEKISSRQVHQICNSILARKIQSKLLDFQNLKQIILLTVLSGKKCNRLQALQNITIDQISKMIDSLEPPQGYQQVNKEYLIKKKLQRLQQADIKVSFYQKNKNLSKYRRKSNEVSKKLQIEEAKTKPKLKKVKIKTRPNSLQSKQIKMVPQLLNRDQILEQNKIDNYLEALSISNEGQAVLDSQNFLKQKLQNYTINVIKEQTVMQWHLHKALQPSCQQPNLRMQENQLVKENEGNSKKKQHQPQAKQLAKSKVLKRHSISAVNNIAQSKYNQPSQAQNNITFRKKQAQIDGKQSKQMPFQKLRVYFHSEKEIGNQSKKIQRLLRSQSAKYWVPTVNFEHLKQAFS